MLEEEDGYVEIGPQEGFGGLQPTLIFSSTTEPKATKLRPHIDINPSTRTRTPSWLRASLGIAAVVWPSPR